MKNLFAREVNRGLAFGIILGVGILFCLLIIIFYAEVSQPLTNNYPPAPLAKNQTSKKISVEQFASKAEFKEYVSKAAELQGESYGKYLLENSGLPSTGLQKYTERSTDSLERVSQTTVQVRGIDEPDIVKTNGEEIYFSGGAVYFPYGAGREGVDYMMPRVAASYQTNVINAFPPEGLALEGKIAESGDLLLSDDTLIIFSRQHIYGYDVSNPAVPVKSWEMQLREGVTIFASRLYEGSLYLVTREDINEYDPCPIKPLLMSGEESVIIPCASIYHPTRVLPIDTTFVAMVIDPLSSKVEKTLSFIGSSQDSLLYMSPQALYVTYYYAESMVTFFSDFLQSRGQDLFAPAFIEKVKRLESYDISNDGKFEELESLMRRYMNSLDKAEMARIENEITNRMYDYFGEHKREFEKTVIVKIGLDDFSIKATGSVPGYPLNQFALDEYEGNLRIATTVWEHDFLGAAPFNSGDPGSANDVYVLNKNLMVEGAVEDLGRGERIYAARFIGDKGYLVTFREIDPFYVLDLSNPKNPRLAGELKIPGYSTFLEPITKNTIAGIGKEGAQVKVSLFDVSSPENPREIDTYMLKENWSDVLSTHHAFLMDTKHKIFFLPGSKGGYIFSYENNKLTLARVVPSIAARRALYINDYLYVIGDPKIIVLNETNWDTINELALGSLGIQ